MRSVLFGVILLCGLVVAEAEEPTWFRYPSISPDGQTIVFVYDGDLYTVPSAGGRAVALTQHVAYDYRPLWSPDGKTIAFASERQGNFDVHVIPAAGGEVRRLTSYSGGDVPSGFSPDGTHLLFSSSRTDAVDSLRMPSWRMSELYSIPVKGGRVRQVLTTPAEGAVYDASGKRILYQDRKGGEDPMRKHHTSAITRDLWIYDVASGGHTKITNFVGEDRNPVWGSGEEVFYLSEQSGSLNVWTKSLKAGAEARPLTNFEKHPVRFLSRSGKGVLCFGYDGAIYTLAQGGEPVKLQIEMAVDAKVNSLESKSTGKVTEMALSPDGKEVAFIARGEVFVTSLEHKATKRITHTPEQERSVSFHPEGKKLLYASEREGSWNLYTSKIAREDEELFHLATLIEEEAVLTDAEESFQPFYSPDGKSIAYLEEREALVVLDVASGKKRTLLDGSRNYSYRDGDIEFSWSPDSKWLLSTYLPLDRWVEDIVLVAADGKGEVVNMTLNGYSDMNPQWAQNGEVMLWMSDRYGPRSHGSWGSEDDVFGLFLTKEAHREFKKTEAEAADDSEKKDDKDEKEDKDDKEDKEEKEDEEKEDDEKEVPAVVIEFDQLEDRVERLTKYSSNLGATQLSPKGETLYYLSKENGEQKLWKRDLRKDEMKVLASFPAGKSRSSGPEMVLSKDGKTLAVLAAGQLYRVGVKDGKKESVSFRATMEVDHVAEREHLFEHVWRQVKKKFYRSDLQGVDWEFYRKEYHKHLPQIRNSRDFAGLLSEMLGELNASHTGARYYGEMKGRGHTASLGVFHDWAYNGPGIRVLEVMERGPLSQLEKPLEAGGIIEKINGREIVAGENHYARLWRLEGERVLLSFHDPKSGERWEEVVRPVGLRKESELTYRRWLARMREETDRLSGGKIGYVHIKGMNDGSFREFYGEVFGRHGHKKALVVDTRFNGGGWLTEDLTAFLSGVDYLRFYPREKSGMGGQPIFRWSKPSAVLMGEGNYSDAHLFPFAYKAMGIGKLVGMPVPGTGTAVWWEPLMDPELLFGIPQVGMVGRDGSYMENTQLEPDIRVELPPEDGPKKRDRQLEAAVKHLFGVAGAGALEISGGGEVGGWDFSRSGTTLSFRRVKPPFFPDSPVFSFSAASQPEGRSPSATNREVRCGWKGF